MSNVDVTKLDLSALPAKAIAAFLDGMGARTFFPEQLAAKAAQKAGATAEQVGAVVAQVRALRLQGERAEATARWNATLANPAFAPSAWTVGPWPGAED